MPTAYLDNRHVCTLVKLVVFILAFSITLAVYVRHPYVYGIDGPYYIVQYYSLKNELRLRYPDPPLAFLILYPFEYLSETITGTADLGLKICVSLITAFMALILFVISYRIIGDLVFAATISILFSLCPHTLRIETDFIKNTIALLFITILIYILSFGRYEFKFIITAIVVSLAASLSHITGLCLSITIPVLYILTYILVHKRARRDLLIALASAVTAVALLPASIFYPPLLGGDLRRITEFLGSLGMLGNEAQTFNQAPVLKQPLFDPSRYCIDPIVYHGFMYLLSALTILLFIRRGTRRHIGVVAAILSICLLILNLHIYPQEYGFRFRLMSCIFVPLALSTLSLLDRRLFHVMVGCYIGFILVGSSILVPRLGPSLPDQAINEVKLLDNYIEPYSKVFIPHRPLRYWFEALHYGKYVVIDRRPYPWERVYIVVPRMYHLTPRHALLVYEGKYIVVFRKH